MSRNKLTAFQVANAGDGVFGDGDGLNLRVRGNSRKWIFRFMIAGKVTEMGLGSANKVSLKLARELRAQQRRHSGRFGCNSRLGGYRRRPCVASSGA
jgi:hypothetical protein